MKRDGQNIFPDLQGVKLVRTKFRSIFLLNRNYPNCTARMTAPSPLVGEGMHCVDQEFSWVRGRHTTRTQHPGHPLYLHGIESVRWKRLSALAGDGRPKRVAMSPVTPPASTVGELGIFAMSRTTEQSLGSQSHEQGRLP